MILRFQPDWHRRTHLLRRCVTLTGQRSKARSSPPARRRVAKVSLSPGEFFQLPGSLQTLETRIPSLAAGVHESLLRGAATTGGMVSKPAERLLELMSCPRARPMRQRLLLDPLFIRYLHSLARFSAEVREWHDQAAAICPAESDVSGGIADDGLAGNLFLPLMLRADPQWTGAVELKTDGFGRLRFPVCDWSIELTTTPASVCVHHPVVVSIDRRHFRWYCADADGSPFLVMPRADSMRMLVANDDEIESGTLSCEDPVVRPKLHRSAALCAEGVCYEPTGFIDNGRAGVVGGVVERVLAAMRHNSASIHQEFCRYTRTVRGFESPPSDDGFVQSFSDPREPGIVGVNVPCSPDGCLRLDPCCFACFGHELGHTKSYLIDSVAYAAGLKLARNTSDWTEVIPRYGRRLRVRTLLQIPYTHLYELALVVAFVRNDCRGWEWCDPQHNHRIAEDLQLEIVEAFALIDGCADLTRFGESVFSHLRQQFTQLQSQWAAVIAGTQ